MTQAGKLRTWVRIQTQDATQDAMGQPSTTWKDWQTVWARVVSVTGSENYKGQQFSPEVTHQVTMRWLDGLTPLQRLVIDNGTQYGQCLDILTVNYGERRLDDEVKLTCKERIAWQGVD